MNPILQRLYDGWLALLEILRSPFLLAVRLYWGINLMLGGWGKLTDLKTVTGYFDSLHIPFPQLNALLAACTETFGGLLFALGFASRIVPVPLLFVMGVAYATAEQDSLKAIWTDPDKFVSATPFEFAFAFLLVLLFGPGKLSIDGWLGRKKNAAARE